MDKNKLRRIIREEIQNLNESNMSGAIYHFTFMNSLISILRGDYLDLKKVKGDVQAKSELRFQRGRSHFASFTTIKNGTVGYSYDSNAMNFGDGVDVRIAFNARKLGFNYKLVPAQYFVDEIGDFIPSTRNQMDENEIRLISNKGKVEGISKYIEYVDIRVSKNAFNEKDSTLSYNLKKTSLFAKKRGIELRYFLGSDWNNGRKMSSEIYDYVMSL
jgi:hypothetical protein